MISCAKRCTGSNKPNRSVRRVTTTPFCVGIRARGSLSETNSFHAHLRNESNYRWNNCRASVSDATLFGVHRNALQETIEFSLESVIASANALRCDERRRRLYALRTRRLGTRRGQIQFGVVIANAAVYSSSNQRCPSFA